MADAPKLEHKPPPAVLPQQAQAQKNVGRPKRTPDDQAEYFYNQRKMHRLMFISSFLLLFSLVLMFWDDYWGVTPAKNRDWKNYQKVYMSAELARLQFEIRDIEESIGKEQGELDKVDRKIALEEEKLRSPKEIRSVTVNVLDPKTGGRTPVTENVNLGDLEKKVAGIKGEYELKMSVMNIDKSEYATLRHHYEEAEYHLGMARKKKDPRLAHFEKEFEHARAKWEGIQKKAEKSKAEYDDVDARKTKVDDQILALKADLLKLKADQAKRLKERQEKLVRLNREKPQVANTIRNAPMLDFFDPSIKIQQQIIPTIFEDLNFVKVEKIDRCHTCHRGIDNPAYEVELFPDAKAPEERVVFKDKNMKAFVNHARGKVEGACDICKGVADGWMISQVAHGSWDADEAIQYTKALMAHPQPELYAFGGSPHALDKVGCTVCHGGDGRDTEFSRAVHMPDTDVQKKEWEKRHHYHYRHLWDAPMLPKRHIYSSCRACHSSEVELPTGDTFDNDYIQGMKLFERAGCYACHRTDSYQILPKDTDPIKNPKLEPNRRYRRPGPPLTHIRDKVDPNWAARWVLAPKAFRLATRMPHFFGQSNARTLRIDGKDVGPEKVEPVIVGAMIKYLFEVSGTRSYKPLVAPEKQADPVRGQAIFEQVGCRGCHTATPDSEYSRRKDLKNEDDQWRAPEGGESWMLKEFGPNLAGIASKFRDDPERGRTWLFNWVKDPKHYFKGSRMPNLRLTDQEAHDLTAWLMTLSKEGDFDQRPGMPEFGDAEHKILDTLIYEQLRSKLPDVDAQAAVVAMKEKPAEKVLWFGRKLVQNYGCYSCHEMNPEKEKEDPFLAKLPLVELPIDWTDIEGVGVELTGSQPEGNKAVDRLAFGYTHFDGKKNFGVSFDHAFYRKPYRHLDSENPEPDVVKVPEFRHLWIRNKLLDPRVFDGGRLSALPPDELLKMPNFYFNEKEVRLLTTFVLSFTNQDVPLGLVSQAKKRLSEDEQALNRGHRIIRENNCRGCHQLSLERLEVQWTRDEMVSGAKKEIKSWEWIEGLNTGKVDEDAAAGFLQRWGVKTESPKPELYTFNWVSDNCSLKMPGAVNPASRFVLVDGSSRWYIDTDGQKLNRDALPVRRWRSVDGGEIQLLILKYKKDHIEDWKDKDDNYLVDLDNPQAMFSRMPPMLRTQGSKTQAQWLFDFLKSPHPIRPALAPIVPGGKGPPDLNVRMPTFGFSDEEAGALLRFFWARDRLQAVESHPFTHFPEKDDAVFAAGKPVFDKVVPTLLKNCAECHYTAGKEPDGGFESSYKFAPELANVEDRFRSRWLYSWLKAPGEIYPGTSMTAYWGQIPDDLKPFVKDSDDGVRVTVEFLMNFGRLKPAPPPPADKK